MGLVVGKSWEGSRLNRYHERIHLIDRYQIAIHRGFLPSGNGCPRSSVVEYPVGFRYHRDSIRRGCKANDGVNISANLLGAFGNVYYFGRPPTTNPFDQITISDCCGVLEAFQFSTVTRFEASNPQWTFMFMDDMVMIPEPITATLIPLALAPLVMRRRRAA